MIDQVTLMKKLNDKKIDTTKPMIFCNAGPKNCCAQAVCMHLGIKNTKIATYDVKDWKAAEEKKKADKEAPAKQADKQADQKPETTN